MAQPSSPFHDPLTGRTFATYRLERLIGRGGMASVYYASDLSLNRPVAVKVIGERFRDNPTFTSRFLQEARTVAAWRHENIIQVYYAGEESGLFFFVMEYIDGPDLAHILAEQKQSGRLLDPQQVLQYGRAIASALDYAHRKGVIHRDVKPSNVLVSKDGRIVLGDFGLALDVNQGSLGEVFGTARYTAPEQARRSSSAVPQSDLYSLGVMLYEMLTGALPFDDPSPASVALQHLTLPPPPPRQLNPALSPEVEVVLLKALSKNPSDRYPRGADLMGALETALIPEEQRLPAPGVASTQGSRPRFPEPPIHPIPAASPRRIPPIYFAGGALFVLIALIWGAASLVRSVGSKPTPSSAISLSTSTPRPASATPKIPSKVPPSATSVPIIPTKTASRSPSASPTVAPSASATPTSTLVPPAVTSTSTLAPPTSVPNTSTAQQPTSPPSPTPKYLTGRKFILDYNASGFYMRQVTGYGGLIAPAAFERLDAQGNPLNRFDGDRWAEYHSSTLNGWCMRLEILNAGPYQPPQACENHYLATRWPASDDPGIFWTPQPGSTFFRVLWGDEEVARCEIAAGSCEVYLP